MAGWTRTPSARRRRRGRGCSSRVRRSLARRRVSRRRRNNCSKWRPPRNGEDGPCIMAMTFDATLKDMGRESPQGFLSVFDRPPTLPVRLLNVDLSTVTTTADLILGLGEPLLEIVQIDFQTSAAAWK